VSVVLDTSIIIPYLGGVAYDRFVWNRLVREQIYISSASGMELLAGSLRPDQRRRADAFLNELVRASRIVTPDQDEWLRAGLILARFQNRIGHVDPARHINDLLIFMAAERIGAVLITENGDHFRLWSRFRPEPRRPHLMILNRGEHLNSGPK